MAQSSKKVVGDDTVHYVSARTKRERPKPKMQPPLTPMIDVTFQLLLFFLLSFTFREAEGNIPGTLPEEGTGGVAAQEMLDRPIIVNLRPTGDRREFVIYEISELSVSPRDAKELYAQLVMRRGQLGKQVPVVIKPRGDVRWQFVVEAFNQAVRAQFENIGFAPSI